LPSVVLDHIKTTDRELEQKLQLQAW
jgi:hypothetical protein